MMRNLFSVYKNPSSEYMKIFYCTKSFNKKTFINNKNELTDYDDGINLEEVNVHSAQEQDLIETQHAKNTLRMQIIKQKYFKTPKEINFLSWSQKQTIKFLHRSDPDTWTIEKITEQYPVTISGLEKLLDSQDWKPKDIGRHDKAVARNWELLSQNKLPLDITAKDHLMKFFKDQHKYLEITDEKKYITASTKPLKNGEFSNFIKGFENSETCLPERKNYEKRETAVYDDYLIAPLKKLTNMTLEEFKKKYKIEEQLKQISNEKPTNYFLQSNHTENTKENEEREEIRPSVDEKKVLENQNFEEKFIEKSKEKVEKKSSKMQKKNKKAIFKEENELESYDSSTIELEYKPKSQRVDYVKDLQYEISDEELMKKSKDNMEKNSKIQNRPKEVERIEETNIITSNTLILDNNMEQNIVTGEYIPHRISIPKNKYKRGALYRVGDIFYDDDGTFLYKVPGLMKNK